MSNKVATDVRERLAAARKTTGELQRNRSELIRQMRRVMGEIGALRDRLKAQHAARRGRPSSTAADRLAEQFHLTPRELEVALLLSGGASNAFIATTLGISEHTARNHTRHVLLKLGLHSRAQAAALIALELADVAARIP